MRLTLTASFLVLAALPAAALAQGYAGGSIGERHINLPCESRPDCDNSDTAWRFYAGYEFSDRFAFEAGYHDLGGVEVQNRDAHLTAIETSFVGTMAIGNRTALLGRVGLARTNGTGGGSSFGPVVGLGFGYELTRRGQFRLEWHHFDKLGANAGVKFNADVVSFGLAFRL